MLAAKLGAYARLEVTKIANIDLMETEACMNALRHVAPADASRNGLKLTNNGVAKKLVVNAHYHKDNHRDRLQDDPIQRPS